MSVAGAVSANPKQIFPHNGRITMNEKTEILSQIKLAVQRVDPKADLILFGSQARGDQRADSDWDILVLTEKEINTTYKNAVRNELYYIQIMLEISISSLFRSKHKWENESFIPVEKEIKREGVYL